MIMADRTFTTISVRIATRDQVNAYRKALRSGFGRKASTEELLLAFIEGIPLAHAAYMMDQYVMEHETDDEDET
jgi:hypothetical protein